MEENKKEILTEKEAKTYKKLFEKFLAEYKKKEPSITDEQWLEQLFARELPELTPEEAKQEAKTVVNSIADYDENLRSVNEAAKNGVSKEKWLADKLQESSVGLSVNEFGQSLEMIDNELMIQNDMLHEMLEGNVLLKNNPDVVSMNKNLDGFIAEDLISSTANLNSQLSGENVRVNVLKSHNANSVDVRATDLTTGKYQNYQLKFGKTAKDTIKLIEGGNYNNQRIIVPEEQLVEIQKYFADKGSLKTISDHIEAFGVEGKSFTKEKMKELQQAAQSDGVLPTMDYNHYDTKLLAKSVGKSAGVMALQSAAITTGYDIVSKIAKGEKIDPDETVEIAIKTGADTAVKTVSAGALQVAIRRGKLKFIPQGTPAGVIADIACVGIEDAKILYKVSTGELSMTKGLDQMGRTTVSMTGGIYAAGKGFAIGAAATSWIPVIGPFIGIVTGLVGGTVGYFAGSKVGDAVYGAVKKVAPVAKNVGKAAYNGLKRAGRVIGRGLKRIGRKLRG